VPSEHSPSSMLGRERVPELVERIGEDPARWLDRSLFGGESDTSAPGIMIRARIRGIDDLGVLSAWKAVERRLDRGPREKVMQMLEDREQELEEIGERPDRLQERDGRDVPETEWYLVRDGERLPWSEADRKGATVSFDNGAGHAVTDGSEES